jgi:hypothetical protein
MEKTRNAYIILIWKCPIKFPLEQRRRKQQMIVKINDRELLPED